MVFYHTVLPGTPLHLRKKLNLHFEHNSKNQLQTSQRRLVHVHNTSLDSPARADKWSIQWLYGDHRWWVGLCVSWGETATSQPNRWTVKPVSNHWEWIKTLAVINASEMLVAPRISECFGLLQSALDFVCYRCKPLDFVLRALRALRPVGLLQMQAT